MWALQVCVTQQDMLFASLTLEQGIKLNLHLWKMGRFYFKQVQVFSLRITIILDQA